MRISNFLIWQAAYAEWYITPTCGQTFKQRRIIQAIASYGQRDRRFGKVSGTDNEG
jgi:undecaprenyl diphosphate synthase